MAPVADNGRFTHFIAIGRDVTERFKNSAAIKDQNLKLNEIGRIQSHDLRGPLARIKGLINLLANYSDSMDNNGTAELMNYLKISAKEMDQVIKRIIDLSMETPIVD
jgi:K+-sensing histidine kinase KdpD